MNRFNCYIRFTIRLDRWREGGLRQKRNNGGGCATIALKIGKRGEPWYTYVTE